MLCYVTDENLDFLDIESNFNESNFPDDLMQQWPEDLEVGPCIV